MYDDLLLENLTKVQGDPNHQVNFKYEKFTQDQEESCSFRKRNAENEKIIKIRPRLDIAIQHQSFKSKFFSERMFLYRGFSLLQSEHPLFLHFPIQNYLTMPQKVGKKWVFTFTKMSFLKYICLYLSTSAFFPFLQNSLVQSCTDYILLQTNKKRLCRQSACKSNLKI